MGEASQQRYQVIEKLESGGMAEVFRAASTGLQGFRKQVAIKRVLPHLSEKKRFISMFLDEARLSAHLSHSNCVQVFDIGVGDNAYFIVMEFVDGANLKSIIEALQSQGRQFPIPTAVFVAQEICKGLCYAHELRDPNGKALHIVHRDMSPPNVLVTKHGEVKIVDFGLAKANSQLEKSEPGIIKGKFSYLSPEAALGQEVDHRTDIFALGIILWEMLTSRRLFLGESDFQTVKKVQEAHIPSIREINPRVQPDLEEIVKKALARDPAERYQTARAFGRDLVRYMFRFGDPISTFDIEALVVGVVKEKAKARMPQHSIIDKLIEEALLEFTSLKDDEGSKAAPSSNGQLSEPLDLGAFGSSSNWVNEIAVSQRNASQHDVDPLRASLPPGVFEAGNLSALEDGGAPKPPGSPPTPGPSAFTPPAGAPANPGAAVALPPGGAKAAVGMTPQGPTTGGMPRPPAYSPMATPPLASGRPPARRSVLPIAIAVFFVVLTALLLVAWFTGLIPRG